MIEQGDIQQEQETAQIHYGSAEEGTQQEALWEQNYLLAMQLELQLRQAQALERIAEAVENLVSVTPRQ